VARKASLDRSVVQVALKRLKRAKTVSDLRRAQAVAFPDRFGVDLQMTGEMIGKSRTSVARLRREFVAWARGKELPSENWGGRRRQNMTREEEARIVAPFFHTAKKGGILTVSPIRKAYEQAVGHRVPDSTIYRILARHGWRKLAPDKRHPKADPSAQEAFKKNSQRLSGPKKS
jgi:hypothetical protein